jgi:hypothetical protein
MLASLIAFVCSGIVIAALIIWYDRFSLLGFTRPIYFVILVALGLCAAGFLFGALRSYAKYTGTVLNGTLELGGPVVALMLLVMAGLVFAPPSDFFDLVVRLHGPGGVTDSITTGEVTVAVGRITQKARAGTDGQFHFTDLPSSIATSEVLVMPDVKGYALKDSGPRKMPASHVLSVELVPATKESEIHGLLQYSNQSPAVNAELSVNDGLVTAHTNDKGEFRFKVPFDNGDTIRLVARINGRIGYDNFVTVPVGTTLTFAGRVR